MIRSSRSSYVLAVVALGGGIAAAQPPHPPAPVPHTAAVPNAALKLPFKDDARIEFVAAVNKAEWAKLTAFWNEATEEATDPVGGKVARRVVRIKVPLGLSKAPDVPPENPMTVAKWALGKRLYYDKVLSANGKVACATCHDPKKGFTDQLPVSLGINDEKGGINAPTVVNSAYHKFQFWDGRATSLEDQSQGPVGNPKEMFAGGGDAWEGAVKRLRQSPEYVKQFEQVFGHAPTRDAAAKAIAAYERTVLVGNSVYDRAEAAMKKRVADDDAEEAKLKPADFAKVLKQAFAAMDTNALKSLGLDPDRDVAKADAVGAKLASGRALFFGKARCSNCHVGDNFTDLTFHNLGAGAKDGVLPEAEYARFAALPTGHKDPAMIGGQKTPGLRGLLDTAPYLHDGSEKTLEGVIDFYDRGGNVNEFLDPKMRDTEAEAKIARAWASGQKISLPEGAIKTRDGSPVIPFKLNLTGDEKADLVLFLKALQGDPVDPTVADPGWFPKK
jgi:cytochrome c peroxidase